MNKTNLIAIDPGSNKAGIAIFKESKLIYSEQLNFKAKDSFYNRLRALKLSVESFLAKYGNLGYVCVETPYVGRNPQTGLKLGMARGIILSFAFKYNINVIDISPQEIRSHYGVRGNAKKEEYQKIVKLEFAKEIKKELGEDEADAIAIGSVGIAKIRNAILLTKAN